MSYDFRKRSDDSKLNFEGTVSLVKPEFSDLCDINKILKKYARNGVNPFVVTESAQYGDFTAVPSYPDALCLIRASQARFAELPAALRYQFNNDPANLISFLSDPANRDAAIELGLIDKPLIKPVALDQNPPEADSNTGVA
jgi:phage internal scaffolding protein